MDITANDDDFDVNYVSSKTVPESAIVYCICHFEK